MRTSSHNTGDVERVGVFETRSHNLYDPSAYFSLSGKFAYELINISIIPREPIQHESTPKHSKPPRRITHEIWTRECGNGSKRAMRVMKTLAHPSRITAGLFLAVPLFCRKALQVFTQTIISLSIGVHLMYSRRARIKDHSCSAQAPPVIIGSTQQSSGWTDDCRQRGATLSAEFAWMSPERPSGPWSIRRSLV